MHNLIIDIVDVGLATEYTLGRATVEVDHSDLWLPSATSWLQVVPIGRHPTPTSDGPAMLEVSIIAQDTPGVDGQGHRWVRSLPSLVGPRSQVKGARSTTSRPCTCSKLLAQRSR